MDLLDTSPCVSCRTSLLDYRMIIGAVVSVNFKKGSNYSAQMLVSVIIALFLSPWEWSLIAVAIVELYSRVRHSRFVIEGESLLPYTPSIKYKKWCLNEFRRLNILLGYW